MSNSFSAHVSVSPQMTARLNQTVSVLRQAMEHITNAMQSLMDTLHHGLQSIASRGASLVRIVTKEHSSLIVDRVITSLTRIRRHLLDIKASLDNHSMFRQLEDVAEQQFVSILEFLYHKMDTLTKKMHTDSYFRETFGWMVSEINALIRDLIGSISQYHLSGHHQRDRGAVFVWWYTFV